MQRSWLTVQYAGVQAVLSQCHTRVFTEGCLWCGERMTLSAWPHSWNHSKQDLSVPCSLLRRTRLWMEAGWKTFAVVLQHCSEAECLCIDLAERENREIFHMFISRTPRDKQPSPSLSLLLLKAQPAQVIKILPSQGEITLCLVAKAQSWKDSYSAPSLFVLLSGLPFLPSFIYQICASCT